MTLPEIERMNDLMDKEKYQPERFTRADHRELRLLQDQYNEEEYLSYGQTLSCFTS